MSKLSTGPRITKANTRHMDGDTVLRYSVEGGAPGWITNGHWMLRLGDCRDFMMEYTGGTAPDLASALRAAYPWADRIEPIEIPERMTTVPADAGPRVALPLARIPRRTDPHPVPTAQLCLGESGALQAIDARYAALLGIEPGTRLLQGGSGPFWLPTGRACIMPIHFDIAAEIAPLVVKRALVGAHFPTPEPVAEEATR